MYRVLIVDDEPVIRNGISAIINWEKEGMLVQDDCENGVEALHALKNNSFDILITDIKMPLMDGIELMNRAWELYPSLKVILISGYNDFEYVREGLKLGAVDYLLKAALDPEDLLSVLQRCVALLDKERKKTCELQDYMKGAVYRDRKILEQDIKRTIVQKQSFHSPYISEAAWLDEAYLCAYLTLDRAEEWKENRGELYVQFLMEELQEMFYAGIEAGVALTTVESGLFFILPDKDGEAERLLCDWKQLVEVKWEISTSVGINAGQGSGYILKGLSDSRAACERRFFEGLGGYYKIKDRESDNGSTVKKDWKPFFEILSNGDPAASAVEFALEQWNSGDLNPEQVREEACSLLLQAHVEQVLPEWVDLLRRAETLGQLGSLMIDQLKKISNPYFPELEDKGLGGQVITKALEYISDHFTENLTLQSVADTVHLSKNYFSLLFKKQTGLNFIDYLIELRIREAKRLLAQNNDRISDVVGPSGFNDVKYFNRIFKKVTGMTPKEYREKHQVTGMFFN